MLRVSHRFASLFQTVGQVTGALYCLPACVREFSARGGCCGYDYTHDDSRRQDTAKIHFGEILDWSVSQKRLKGESVDDARRSFRVLERP